MARTQKSILEYRIYDLPPQLPLIGFIGERWRISDTLSGRLHFHNCLEIGLCRSDSGILGFADGQIPFTAGDVTLIPRYLPHTTCSSPGTRSLWCYLFVDFDQLFPQDEYHVGKELMNYLSTRYVLSAEATGRLPWLIQTIIQQSTSVRPEGDDLLRAYCFAMTLQLERLAMREKGTQQFSLRDGFALRPALEYMHAHFSQPCGMGELAAACHLSETHFRRLFHQVMGSSPLRFLNETRIRHACSQLSATNDPVTDIAQRVGMPSIASFNRNFQQVTGTNPRAFRAKMSAEWPLQQRKILPYPGWLEAEEKPDH